MYSLLYTYDGKIFHAGPFKTEEELLEYASAAQREREFDILDMHVYVLTPEHHLVELAIDDVVPVG